MTEAGLKTLIETALSIPVFEGKDSITYPAATLECQENKPELFGDGLIVRRMITAFINLWYEDKAGRDNAITELLKVFDFRIDISAPDIESYYDTTAKKYRAILTVRFLYEGTNQYFYNDGHLYQDAVKKQYDFTYDAPEGELQYTSLGGTDTFSLQAGKLYVNETNQ
jgi:hypothetical protein